MGGVAAGQVEGLAPHVSKTGQNRGGSRALGSEAVSDGQQSHAQENFLWKKENSGVIEAIEKAGESAEVRKRAF